MKNVRANGPGQSCARTVVFCLFCAGVLGSSGLAAAQDAVPTPVPAKPAEPAMAAAAEGSPQATSGAPSAASSTTTEAGAPAANAETTSADTDDSDPPRVTSWFRFDMDAGGLQLWASATHPLSDTVGLTTDGYIRGPYGQFDIGPAVAAGPFVITNMVGLQVDMVDRRAQALVPSTYIKGGPFPLYMELWVYSFFNSVFRKGADNPLYARLFVDARLSQYIAVGPQIEAHFATNDAGKKLSSSAIQSMPVGGSVVLTNYGADNTLQLFAGYETAKGYENHFAGRITFIHDF